MDTKCLTGSYADMRRKVYEIKEKYPFTACSVCARSWAGRAIFTLGLGNRKDVALYVGCINAADGKTSFTLLRLFENMCRAYQKRERICGIRLNEILQTKGILVVPCVNPDGMEMQRFGAVAAGCYAGLAQRLCTDSFDSWRANAAGVDLNHNITADWYSLKQLELSVGYTSPGAKFYGGKTCISEPETRALAKLCRNYNVRHIMAVGSGNNTVCAVSKDDAKQDLMLKIFGLCSGLEITENENTLEGHRGFLNWFAAQYGRPAFSLEAGDITGCDYSRFEETAVLCAIM